MSHQGNSDAQQAEIDRLASQVAALREAVPTAHKGDCPTLRKPWLPYDESACECGRRRNLELLADTEAAAREHDRRLRLEGYEQARRELLEGQPSDKIEGSRTC